MQLFIRAFMGDKINPDYVLITVADANIPDTTPDQYVTMVVTKGSELLYGFNGQFVYNTQRMIAPSQPGLDPQPSPTPTTEQVTRPP